MGLHELGALVAVVEFVGSTVGVPALGEDENVGRQKERRRENGDGLQVDVGVVTRGLAGGGAVKVPYRELVDGVLFLLESLLGSAKFKLLAGPSRSDSIR